MTNFHVRRTPGIFLRYRDKDYPLVSGSIGSTSGGYVFTAGLLPTKGPLEIIYGEKGFLHIDNISIKGMLVHSAPLANNGTYTTQLVFKDPFSVKDATYLFTMPIKSDPFKDMLAELKKAKVKIGCMNDGNFGGMLGKYTEIKDSLSGFKPTKTAEAAEEKVGEAIAKASRAYKVSTVADILRPITNALSRIGGVNGIVIPRIRFADDFDYLQILQRFWMQMLKTDMGIVSVGKLLSDWMSVLGLVMLVNPWNGKAYILPRDPFASAIPQNKIMSDISEVTYDIYGSDYPYTASIASLPGQQGMYNGGSTHVVTMPFPSTKIGKLSEFNISVNDIIKMKKFSIPDMPKGVDRMLSLIKSVGTFNLLNQTLSSHTIRVQSEIPYYGILVGYGSRLSVGGKFDGIISSYRINFSPGSIQTMIELSYARQSSIKISKPVLSGLYKTADVELAYKNSVSRSKENQGREIEATASVSYKEK